MPLYIIFTAIVESKQRMTSMCLLLFHVNVCFIKRKQVHARHASFTWSRSKRMRPDTLSTMAVNIIYYVGFPSYVRLSRRVVEEKNCWIKSLFLFSLRTKKYFHSFVKLQLNPWCHMDYFTNILAICLWTWEHFSCIVYAGTESSRISSKIS